MKGKINLKNHVKKLEKIKQKNNAKGITLIALAVTIIILVGVGVLIYYL